MATASDAADLFRRVARRGWIRPRSTSRRSLAESCVDSCLHRFAHNRGRVRLGNKNPDQIQSNFNAGDAQSQSPRRFYQALYRGRSKLPGIFGHKTLPLGL